MVEVNLLGARPNKSLEVCIVSGLKQVDDFVSLRRDSYKNMTIQERKGLLGKGKTDYLDHISPTLIVQEDDKCIGGIRVVFGGEDIKLPLEYGNFSLRDVLPSYKLHNNYIEAGRLVFAEGYRNSKYIRILFRELVMYCKQNGIDYIFAAAPKEQARLYKLYFTAMNIRLDISENILLPIKPTDEGRRMELIIVHLNEAIQQKEKENVSYGTK